MQKTERTERQDVYTRITAQIVADLEKGVRPWVKPWNAEHAAGRITRPRHNGQPYSGINILSLWMSATAQNFAAPIWMTFRQALELDAHVRKGEKGSLVVYANSITRTEHDDKTGEDVEREIPYMKGYTVFNVEQIDGLPEIYYAKAGIHARPRGPHRGKIVLRASRQSPDHRALRVIRFHCAASRTHQHWQVVGILEQLKNGLKGRQQRRWYRSFILPFFG